jgi:tetratricopeptide (TPR) repeat protein
LLAAALVLASAAGCGAEADRAPVRSARRGGARVGLDPVPAVHLFENHSSSLLAWRLAEQRDRVLVHVDGHSDLDWLPDETVARIAAAGPDELAAMDLHPYAMDGSTYRRFGIWNFIYPAARLGVVREYVWVVPDGTMDTPQKAGELVRELVLDKIQMITEDEANTLRYEDRRIRGRVLGLEMTICELADLPAFDVPVLLDIDLDFLTTRSGTTQEVTAEPWITPDELVGKLRERGLRADMATLSYSTMGGYLPPACRWVGPAMAGALRRTIDADGARWAGHAAAAAAARAGRGAEAAALLRKLVAAYPQDGAAWYALARYDRSHGDEAGARRAFEQALTADPLLLDAELFEADGLWMNERYGEARERYHAYAASRGDGPFAAYALRREAGCLMREQRDDEAIALFRKVVAAAPEHADTRLDLGVLLRTRGDTDAAVVEFREARRLLPSRAAYALALGTTYAQQGKLEDALREVQAAVKLRPTWAQAQINLAAILLDIGRPVDAVAALNAAARLAPAHPQLAALVEAARRQGVLTPQLANGR